MNKKYLIIINNFGVGGAERLVIDQANEFVKRKIDFQILTLKKEKESSFSGDLRREVKWQCIDFKSLFSLRSFFNLIKEIKKYKPDVVFTHLWFSNTIGRIVSKICGVNKIISFEHNIYSGLKTKKMFLADFFLQFISYKIIAVSSAVKEDLIKNKIISKKIEVFLNAINLERFENIPSILREQLNVSTEDFIFLSIGRLIPQKGMDVLIKAFSKLSNAILLIVGQGPELDHLKKEAEERGVIDRIKFLGIRLDIPEIIATCDVFVLSSRYEGLGIVVMEAMASGKVVLVSDFLAGRDFILNTKNGIVVPVDNEKELFIAMKKLQHDKNLRINLSKNAIEKSKDFSISVYINKMLELVN